MEYRRFQDTYAVRLDLGEEMMESVKALAAKEGIRLAEVSAIGAADHAVIGVFDLKDRAYRQEEIDGFAEITSLSGNITTMDGKPYVHLHATLADQNHTVHGGHVLEMRVGATCEMFVKVCGGEIGRERDEKLGINLWRF
jgi:hypothetical protein